MKTTRIMAAALLVVGFSSFVFYVARAQQPASKRTDLQRHDLSAPGREVVQVRVDFDPGYLAPRHTHPGEEIVYVLEGTLEYQIEGQPTVTAKPGDVFVHPCRSDPLGEEHRQHQRRRARHLCRRKREAADHVGEVNV